LFSCALALTFDHLEMISQLSAAPLDLFTRFAPTERCE